MALITYIQNNPTMWLLIVPMVLGLLGVAAMVLNDLRHSGRPFWQFLAEMDADYPIKPNSKSMYHKLASISDAHDEAHEKLELVAGKLQDINSKLEELGSKNPAVRAVQEDIAQLLGAVNEPNVNVVNFARRH